MRATIKAVSSSQAKVEVGGQSNVLSNKEMAEVAQALLEQGIDIEVIPGRWPEKMGDNLLSSLLELTDMSFGEQAKLLVNPAVFTIKA